MDDQGSNTAVSIAPAPSDQAQLLEQYKIYIGDLGNIGMRHAQTNTWYVSLLSALLVFLSLTSRAGVLSDASTGAQAAVATLGLVICRMWHCHTQSFDLLYRAKFTVIRKMEEQLPVACYGLEWDNLRDTSYAKFTGIERRISFFLMLPFALVLLLTIARMLGYVL
jgi:hypothetical protein